MTQPEVLYEDNHLLCILKPAGELVQGDATGDQPLVEVCMKYLKEKYDKPGAVYCAPVHRLDRPVSGVLLLARTDKAAARLSEQFRDRKTKKIYRAVVEGVSTEKEKLLCNFLRGDKRRLKTAVFPDNREGAKEAKLIYRSLAINGNRSLLEIELLTGYKHQIRAQLAYEGLPIVGDFKYDHRGSNAKMEKLLEGRAIALHALSLTVEHPTKREPLTFVAPTPDYWPWEKEDFICP